MHGREFVDVFESLEAAVVISCFWAIPPTMQGEERVEKSNEPLR
jgi:hypothetical protein